METPHGKNRLAREKSPYLLQHAGNPVDWYPWGPEAFTKAKTENKPILLSIGYSTCHWCHVMERESFENADLAEVLNRDFVSIKVDREERPDIDRIYMSFVQATSGHGGWPLNVFLTPDLKPFFGGTYWPPKARQGSPGFPDVLQDVAHVWNTRRDEVLASATSIRDQLAAFSEQVPGPEDTGDLSKGLPAKAAELFKSTYDAQHGGFGGAPKFPQPSVPRFLLAQAARSGDEEAVRMVLHTCDRMAAGGIYDQLGGGFSRYSVDAEWLVPHFEKMLYDNAQLAQLYMDAYSISGLDRYADVVHGILEYVLRDMTDAQGGFYCAEDADSEGQEGKFYCWTAAEVEQLLTPEEARVARRYHGITEHGNFEDHSHPEPLKGLNVLSVVDATLNPEETALLRDAHSKMFQARLQRVRPHRDDKVLASWNGLMLGAMGRAGVMFGNSGYLQAARRNAEFLRTNLWSEGILYHRWREGQRDNAEVLEAPAFVLDGLIQLYEATLDPACLAFAIEVGESLLKTFYDKDQGGFWQSTGSDDLILRLKADYDGAEPSGNSVATLALLKLGKITGRDDFANAAKKTLGFFASRLARAPHSMPWMLMAVQFQLNEPARLVIAGPRAQQADLLRAAHSAYAPNKVVLGTEGPVEAFTHSLNSAGGGRAFVCFGTECRPPVSQPGELREVLENQSALRRAA